MKTLAPFVVVCLALLTLLGWQLCSAIRDTATTSESPATDGRLPPPRTDRALPAEDRAAPEELGPAPAAPADALVGLAKAPAAPTTAPTTQVVGNEPLAAAAPATQSVVHWATDVRQRRMRQRFIRLRETLVSEPHNEAALEAALELARQLQWHNEACDLLGRLVRLRPEDAALRFELAIESMRLERWLEAIPQLRSVVRRQPENGHAWYGLAIAHQALGHLHDARVTWDRVAQLLPENADVFARRGEVLLDLGDWAAAAADFETALRLEPDSIDAAMNLSLALSRLGRLAEARQGLLPLLEQRPRYVPLLNRLAEIAWALYQDNPVDGEALSDETVSLCRRSLAVAPDQPDIKALLKRASPAGQ